MKHYEHILIDWDGNLAKTLDVWLDGYKEILGENGYYPTDQEIAAGFGSPLALFENLGLDNPTESLARVVMLAHIHLPHAELYPGAADLLNSLDEVGKHKALISSSDRTQVEPLLRRHNLEKYFRSIITGDIVQHRKPHIEPLVRAMAELSASAETTIIIGDSESDLIPAKVLGIDSILFFPEEHNKFYNISRLVLHGPTYIVDNLGDVVELLGE